MEIFCSLSVKAAGNVRLEFIAGETWDHLRISDASPGRPDKPIDLYTDHKFRKNLERAVIAFNAEISATTELKYGDPCRAKCTAPARYVGNGKCVYISCSDNDRRIDDAREPDGNEREFPLVNDAELEVWRYKISTLVGAPSTKAA